MGAGMAMISEARLRELIALWHETKEESLAPHLARVVEVLLPLLEAAEHTRELLLDRLLHGDEAHRQWLADELAFVFAPQDRVIAAARRVITKEVSNDT